MIQNVTIKDFSGAIATTSEKKDIPNSAKFVKNLNPFEDPTYITLSKKPTKMSGSTVTNLVYWMEDGSPYDTNRYFYDLGGKIYCETNADVWSSLRTVSGGAGEGLKVFDDYLYYALGTELGRYGKLSGTPAFNDALTSWYDSHIADIQTTGGGTGQTYATTTAIDEGATHRQTVSVEHDPLKAITIDINDTGDDPTWTVTVHDDEDKLIGAKTIAFASITTGDNVFTFATPLRLVIGNLYHFHVTTSTTTGAPKVTSSAASDLEGAEFIFEYGVLIDTDFHPMSVFETLLVIGNKDYLATFDQDIYNPNAISLDKGYEVRSIAKADEFFIISAFKGNSINEAEESRIFYWDGIAPSFNFVTDSTSVGAGNAITNAGNQLRGIFGNQGALYQGDRPFVKQVSRIPKLGRDKIVNVFPSAITHANGITLVGIGSTDDGTGLEQGIYAYGAKDGKLQDALVLLYLISTGTTQSATVKIGFVKVIGEEIYWGWRDDATYGVDRILPGALAATSGVYESLIFDGDAVNKKKLAFKVQAECVALATNETLAVKQKLDRTANFTAGTAIVSGASKAQQAIYQRFKEMEFGFTLTSSDGTFPKVTELSLEYNDMSEELVR